MRSWGVRAGGLVLLGGALLGGVGPGWAAEPAGLMTDSRPLTMVGTPEIRLPLGELPAEVREKVRQVLDKPTITVRGPSESFACVPATYHWLLEHPDRGVQAWRKLGARCVSIDDLGNGSFGWSDA